jgi:hypothetical protein
MTAAKLSASFHQPGPTAPRDDIVEYYVTSTSRYRRAGASVDQDRPWGLRHARRLGNPLTACGTLASNWPTFLNRRFDSRDDANCPKCVRALAAEIVRFPSA